MGAYPKPGPIGGRLIREVISTLRSNGVQLPISSDILIAASGGSDSTALAHLLAHYGRRVVDRSRITLLHVNHGWRGVQSDEDQEFVRGLAKQWKTKFKAVRLKPPRPRGQSLEEEARDARGVVFRAASLKREAVVLTAHNGDDLAETLLWRLFTGAWKTHGAGILVRHGEQLRPLLRVRKEELRQYLLEEGQPWREDASNSDDRFLRAQMRKLLMPAVERIFPRAVEHLIEMGLEAARLEQPRESEREASPPVQSVFSASGLRLRRAHLEIVRQVANRPEWAGELHLPQGWMLRRESPRQGRPERWILEKS